MKRNQRAVTLLLSAVMLTSCMLCACDKSGGSEGNETETALVIANSEPSLTLSDNVYYLTEGLKEYSAVLRVPESEISGDATEWAKGLKWSLTRSEDDSPYRKTSVKLNVYTGDALESWCFWGHDGMDAKPMFTIREPEVSIKDGFAEIKLYFRAEAFHYEPRSYDYSEFTAFVGKYSFAASSGENTICSTPFDVSLYEGFVAYGDYPEVLSELKKTAEAKGLYFDIRSCGRGEMGEDQKYVVVADSEASVNEYLEYKKRAEKEPEALIDELYNKNGKKPHIAIMTNGVHPNENPSSDTQMKFLSELVGSEALDFCALDGLKTGGSIDKSLFSANVASVEGFMGLGSSKAGAQNNYETDASEFFSISGKKSINVKELLDSAIIIIGLNENPDGAMLATRTNRNGFALNGDVSNQTQQETKNFATMVSQWNPSVFVEFHGYVDGFMVEPFTPPHEPNYEYDLLVDELIRCAEAFGNAGLGSVSSLENYKTKFCSYYVPFRDDFDAETKTWSAASDADISVGSQYTMMNCGAIGITIESPVNSAAGVDLMKYGFVGLLDYVLANKDNIQRIQLEIFKRAVNNEDHRAEIQRWYVDSSDNPLAADSWRVPNPKNNNFFPEYYVIPVDADIQRDIADAREVGEYLVRNGVEVRTLLSDCVIGAQSFKAGSLVVDMHQAKRNYANAVLYDGMNFAKSGFDDKTFRQNISLPHSWGFDCKAIFDVGAMSGKLTEPVSDFKIAGSVKNDGDYAIIASNGVEAVRAINSLLDKGETVGMITSGERKGDYVISKKSFETLEKEYILSAELTSKLPDARKILRPTLWIPGKRKPYSDAKITRGYFSKWFKDGIGFEDDNNMLNIRSYYYDLFALKKKMGFTITSDVSSADIILGSTVLAFSEDAAMQAIKAGTPYIAMGCDVALKLGESLSISDCIVSQLESEALHKVTYDSDSLITAVQKRSGDNIIYSYGCGVFTKIPKGARILIKAAERECILTGCCGSELDGSIEAIEFSENGMNIIAFANSITYYGYQSDDLLFAANAIYSKSLSEAALTNEDF